MQRDDKSFLIRCLPNIFHAMLYPKLSRAHFPFPSSVLPSEKSTAVVGWHRRWHCGGSSWLVPAASTSPRQGYWVETFPSDAKTQPKGWSHYCTSAGAGGHWAKLLIGEGEFIFPRSLVSLKFLLQKTWLAQLCAWEMDLIPQENYLSSLRGRYKINAVMHLSISYWRTELGAEWCKSR